MNCKTKSRIALAPWTNRVAAFLLYCLFSTMASEVSADFVVMKNGDRITGKISRIWDDELFMEPSYTDELAIKLAEIDYMHSDQTFEIELRDEAKLKGQIQKLEGGALTLYSPDGHKEIRIQDIDELNEIVDFDWEVKSDLSSNVSRGNSHTSDWRWYTSGELKLGDHLHNADFTTERKDAEGVKTLDKDHFNYSYKWSYTDDWFVASAASWERDPLRNLNRRVQVGAGLGYYFFDHADRRLSVSVTADAILENFDGSKQESTAPSWNLDYKQDFFGDDAEFFHKHTYSVFVSGRTNKVFNSSTGFSLDITDDIYVKLQLNYDNESDPAEGVKPDDLTYLVGFGVELD